MNRFQSYIHTATQITTSFKGERPFAVFLRQFFAADKKFGARDRRVIAALCYDYFRLGFAAANLSKEDKLLLAFFLCEQEPAELIERLKPAWNLVIDQPMEKKIALTGKDFALHDIFPFPDELSEGVDANEFCSSFLVQPGLFIRLRPQAKANVLKKLTKSGVPFDILGDDCVQLSPATNVQDIFSIDKEVVVQDYNSQKVLDYLKDVSVQAKLTNNKSMDVWDCCAASGGKSILLTDILNSKVDLTVSDIRANIMSNLHLRFMKAGIREYKYFISDISKPDFAPVASEFDLIVCDAPCTGSGTWSRTPEQLSFFKKGAIDEFSNLQQRIATHAFPYLKAGGLFVYITCSVFKKENEDVAAYIREKLNCILLQQQLLKGYTLKADTMFVAVFGKN